VRRCRRAAGIPFFFKIMTLPELHMAATVLHGNNVSRNKLLLISFHVASICCITNTDMQKSNNNQTISTIDLHGMQTCIVLSAPLLSTKPCCSRNTDTHALCFAVMKQILKLHNSHLMKVVVLHLDTVRLVFSFKPRYTQR